MAEWKPIADNAIQAAIERYRREIRAGHAIPYEDR